MQLSFKAILALSLLMLMGVFGVRAEQVTDEKQFLQSLEGIERLTYALPIKAKAQIHQLEEKHLTQNQPVELMVRYYLAKATVFGLLNEYAPSLTAARQGLKLVERSPQQTTEKLMLELRVVQAILTTNVSGAMDQLDELLEHAKTSGNGKVVSEALLIKGQFYEERGDFRRSYAAIMSSLDAAKKTGERDLLERVALGLGNVLVKLQGFERSEQVLQNAYAYFKDRKLAFSQLLSTVTMAELHQEQHQTQKALDAYQESLRLAQLLGDGRYRFRINLQLAALYRSEGQDRPMRAHLLKAENLQYRETSPKYLSIFRLLQAQDKLEQKQYQELIAFITPILSDLKQSAHLQREQVELIKIGAQVYAGAGNFKQAYEIYGDYHDRSVQLRNRKQIESLERQQILFELERLEYENQDLNWNNVLQKLEIEQNRKIFYLLGKVLIVLVVIILLLLAGFIWVNRARIKMRRLAKTDALTGLYNRRFLEEWFIRYRGRRADDQESQTSVVSRVQKLQDQIIIRLRLDRFNWLRWIRPAEDSDSDNQTRAGRRMNGPVSLIATDVDHFKQINDTYGHPFGDKVLAEISAVARSLLGPFDIAARVGGEEFIIILPDARIAGAVDVAEDLRSALEAHEFMTDDGEIVVVTASFGVVATENPALGFQEMCLAADQKLYEAKNNGRNCIRYTEINGAGAI